MNDKLLTIFNDVEAYHWWFLGRRFLLEKVLKKYKGKKKIQILDVGCGSGGNIKFLSQFGRVYGVDKSRLAVSYCKKNGYKNVRYADATKLPFKEKQFDIVFLLDVLEHIKDDRKAFQEARRVLKDTGRIVITAPALPFIWSKHDQMQGHFRRYTKVDFYKLAEKTNLTIQRLSYFNTFLLLPIGFIRRLSNFKLFSRLGEYDSTINFDIAKLTILNSILTGIFSLEIKLSEIIEYPAGVSLLGIFTKK